MIIASSTLALAGNLEMNRLNPLTAFLVFS